MEIENDEEEVIILTSRQGFIDKSELRQKVFGDSYFKYQRAVDLLCQGDEAFKKIYENYKVKNMLPKSVIAYLLGHIDVPFKVKNSCL